ncbi:MAG: pyruvate, phosphate dikinase [Candidatus Sericytochromatia bacterium]|nr:pyruvate, phosphate dikinase [Candidatus Sericytochromatia bacterium]
MPPTSSSAQASAKRVYLFAEGDASMRDLLGGKGANLAEMTRAGLPVPPGFTIPTTVCNEYYDLGQRAPGDLWEAVSNALAALEAETGKGFGRASNPLLISVRSGSKFSMPGMMDTILNLGLNDETVQGLIAQTENPRFAYDAYRRFVAMFSSVVLDFRLSHFEHLLEEFKQRLGVKLDTDLDADTLKEIVAAYKRLVVTHLGIDFPSDPRAQLRMAIEAVFRSWNNERAITYRNHHKISHTLGTAVNVQAMVFGNMGDDSGTGVAFTRNPSTGENALYGEYLTNAQGEDVVAGIRTPKPIAELARDMPQVYAQFKAIAERLEAHYRDMQDLEFTVERGTLYMLQTRTGKRTAQAAVKVAVEMAQEGLITHQEALLRVEPGALNQLLHRRIDPTAALDVLARGLPASPGAATGAIVFDADEAERRGRRGEKVILVRVETCPDDIHGMIQAQGVLTSRGGMTSHAAVVARGMGRPCVAGADGVDVNLSAKTMEAAGRTFREGDTLSINGGTGEIIAGEVPMIEPELSPEFNLLMTWADETRRLGVRANADTPEDAAKAREFGAEGIGLCRTEHMFMAPERLPVVQGMILAQGETERRKALNDLLPMQRDDFKGIFRAMSGLPVTIRLLDPPLHEFLPNAHELIAEVALLRCSGDDAERLAEREKLLREVERLSEANPMMGLRGCRLGLTFPEINEMQVRAIFEAACELHREGVHVVPEVMIPLVGHVNELARVRAQLEGVARTVMAEQGCEVEYRFGTMIELPRAALTADQVAREAQFFSFGTNDLTQMTFGYSRDDAEGKFLTRYTDLKILPHNPFEVLDREGVGALMRIAVDKGRSVNGTLKLGVCGEHGGEPSSITFCEELGLDYVSCSPFRVPIARLAAAQATLAGFEGDK